MKGMACHLDHRWIFMTLLTHTELTDVEYGNDKRRSDHGTENFRQNN
jgi:hypothetical protein